MEKNVFEIEYAIRAYKTAVLADGGVSADATVFNTATVDDDAFENDRSIGVTTNVYGMQLLNQPNFDSGQMTVKQRKATGFAYWRGDTGFEFQQEKRAPITTYEFDVTKQNLPLFLWLLFQKGTSQGAVGTGYLKTCVPYGEGESDTEVCAVLLKKMSTTAADSHVIGGAIVKSITLSCSESAPVLKASVELIGYNMVTNYDFNAGPNIIEYDSSTPLLWQNASIKMAGQAVNLPGFTLTVTNNAVAKFYDNPHPVKYVLNTVEGTGSITVPWADTYAGSNEAIDNFIAGTDSLLQIWWGTETPGADGDVKIEVNCRYTGAAVGGDDEVIIECPFDAVHDGTNNAIRIYAADALDRSIT